jgi:hypothetical protein
MASSDARIAANHANSLRSTGPKTAEGKARSSMNARKHEKRAKRETILSNNMYLFEERQRKWTGQLNARNDIEEYLVAKNVAVAGLLDRVELADAERLITRVEKEDEVEFEEVDALGDCLFFNPCGAVIKYGLESIVHDTVSPSWSGLAVDPNKPARIVRKLESSAAGCRWLLAEWAKLGERAAKGSWQSHERFRAARLLGRQPLEAIDDERVAGIFFANHVLKPERDTAFYDLWSDLEKESLPIWIKNVKVQWPETSRRVDPAACRKFLTDLVDWNVARLNTLLEMHEENEQVEAERSVARLGHERTPEADRMRQFQLRCLNTLQRGIDTVRRLQKHKTKEGALRTEGGGRRAENADAVAGKVDAADVLACQGFLPGRLTDGLNSGLGDEGREGAAEIDDCGATSALGGDPSAAVGGISPSRGEEVVDDCGGISSVRIDQSVAEGGTALVGRDPSAAVGGTSPPRGEEANGAEICAELTNEANADHDLVGPEIEAESEVTANSDARSGLDKLQTKPPRVDSEAENAEGIPGLEFEDERVKTVEAGGEGNEISEWRMMAVSKKGLDDEEPEELQALEEQLAMETVKRAARAGPMAETVTGLLGSSPEAMEILRPFLPRAP